LFLDEKGQKISKSKGNGLTIDEWLTYASPESLAQFMYQKPMAAKRLHFDVIPRTVDEYLGFLDAYPRQDWKERLGNPVWHVHSGAPPAPETLENGSNAGTAVSFAMLLNLAAVANSDNPAVLWGFLRRYAPTASPESHPRLDRLVNYAVAYFRDFVAPRKQYRAADDIERGALEAVSRRLATLAADASAEDIQHALYDIARPIPRYQDMAAKGATLERPGVSNEFFNMIYAVLLGETRGPRLGSFIALYGIAETRALIASALAGTLVKPAAE
jgi:lysyl-tRNA synthetase class 1